MRVGRLHHPLGQVGGLVSRQERGRLVVHDLAPPVGHPEDRCVTVTDQVHLRRVHVERVVHLEVVGPDRPAGLRRIGDVRDEAVRLVPVRPGQDVAGRELVQGEAERRQIGRRHQVPRMEGVQVGHGVREAAALDHQPVRLIPEQAADPDGDQNADEGDMEQQVADFPAVPLFGRQPAISLVQPEVPAAEEGGGRRGRLPGRHRGLVPGGVRQPGQMARRARRQGPGRPDQPERPRQDAAGQRGEQQQVDRREPGSGEHVEQAQPVEDRGQGRVGRVVLLHRGRVDPLLRQQRSWHAAQGEQE